MRFFLQTNAGIKIKDLGKYLKHMDMIFCNFNSIIELCRIKIEILIIFRCSFKCIFDVLRLTLIILQFTVIRTILYILNKLHIMINGKNVDKKD